MYPRPREPRGPTRGRTAAEGLAVRVSAFPWVSGWPCLQQPMSVGEREHLPSPKLAEKEQNAE